MRTSLVCTLAFGEVSLLFENAIAKTYISICPRDTEGYDVQIAEQNQGTNAPQGHLSMACLYPDEACYYR